MPVSKRTTSSRTTSAKTRKSAPASKKSSSGSMPDGQKAIYNKLRRKGMSEAQAEVFSKHAHRRKEAAAKRHEAAVKSKPKSTTRKKSGKR